MQEELQNITTTGLGSDEVLKLREQFGPNLLSRQRSARWWKIIWDVVREPMFLLLAIASSLYFILREPREGWMMLFAMAFVIAISVWQDFRSKRAIDALRELTTPTVKVVRDGQTVTVVPAELVPGDIVLLEEGVLVPADGVIISAHDLTVNESVLTGESLPVSKTASEKEGKLFQGTLIETGNCLARIAATGDRSVLGKIGRSMAAIEKPPT
jgi:Ca2+-transporting ATPase